MLMGTLMPDALGVVVVTVVEAVIVQLSLAYWPTFDPIDRTLPVCAFVCMCTVGDMWRY